jgi:hypothetical protein
MHHRLDLRVGRFHQSPLRIKSNHAQVQLGCEPPIQADFFIAEEPPLVAVGEIEKAEIHGLLDLVRVRAGQQHVGNMGLQMHDFAILIMQMALELFQGQRVCNGGIHDHVFLAMFLY